MTFVETKLFTELVLDYLSDDEYAAMQQFLVVSRSGGRHSWLGRLRCRRSWQMGGLRVIYFLRLREDEVWMLTMYAKNVADNITAKVLRKIKEATDAEG